MIETPRLRLVPATIEMCQAELDDRARFARLLDAVVPADWPPPLNDDHSIRWVVDHLTEHPDAALWTMWYFLLRRTGERALAIGKGGFTGAPAPDGTCEVGYSVVESHQRRGYAAEATRGLVDHAFADPRASRVIAHTLPDLAPSIRVLEKCGFVFVGAGEEPGTIRYELRRATTPRTAR